MARTQAQRRADTRSRLLQAAAKRFAADGIERASVDAIADDADRTSGAVYAHFGSKEGLLTALLDSWKNEVVIAATAEITTASSAHERLAALWRNFADPPGDDGASWVQLEHELWLYGSRHPEFRDQLASRYHEAWEQIAAELVRWRDSGQIDPAVPDRALGPLLVALLVGLEMQYRLDPGAVDDEVALAGLAALFGVTTQPAGTRRKATE
jgi:AcrR family transcriptional regulator